MQAEVCASMRPFELWSIIDSCPSSSQGVSWVAAAGSSEQLPHATMTRLGACAFKDLCAFGSSIKSDRSFRCDLCPCRPQLVKGNMQLYSTEQKRAQALEAHAAAFSTLRVSPCHLPPAPCT